MSVDAVHPQFHAWVEEAPDHNVALWENERLRYSKALYVGGYTDNDRASLYQEAALALRAARTFWQQIPAGLRLTVASEAGVPLDGIPADLIRARSGGTRSMRYEVEVETRKLLTVDADELRAAFTEELRDDLGERFSDDQAVIAQAWENGVREPFFRFEDELDEQMIVRARASARSAL